MNPTDLLRSYRETQVKTANQGRLVVMLYDGAIRFLNQALEGLQEQPRRVDRISHNIIRAQDIVAELMTSLDFEEGGEIARSLFSLYVYMNRRLLEANIRKDTAILKEVRRLLTDLRSAWAQLAGQKNAEAGTAGGGGGREGGESGINLAG